MKKKPQQNVTPLLFGPTTYMVYGAYTYEDAFPVIGPEGVDIQALDELKTLYMQTNRAVIEPDNTPEEPIKFTISR